MRVLDQPESAALLEGAGIPVAQTRVVSTIDAALQAADELGYPVVLKAGGLLHKSDQGGVVVGLAGRAETERAARAMHERLGDRALPYLVQPQHDGVEMLLGVRRDPALGAVVVVGFGGVLTEVVGDVIRRSVPVDEQAARAMLGRLRARTLLTGYRGSAPADVKSLCRAIAALSRLAEAREEIRELDLNPLLVSTDGVVAVDARVVVDESARLTRRSRPLGGLGRMLAPQHVAVVGVSDDEGKTGSRVFDSIRAHGFTGRLDAVHPAGGTYKGVRRLASLTEVPGSPDLVCVAVPADAVPSVAAEAVAKQVGALLVHTAGFGEAGPAGAELEAELRTAVTGSDVRVVGPNSMGFVGPGLAASMSGVLTRLQPREGAVALVTSSGALGSCLMSRLWERGIGTSYVVSLGNSTDVDAADVLATIADDEATRVVGLVLEGISDGQALADAVRRCTAAGKPVLALCLGRSDAGAAAAMSHSGVLVQLYDLRVALLESAGAAVTRSLDAMEDALALATMPPPAGPSVCVVCTSGGAATIIADECQGSAVELTAVDAKLRARLERVVPAYGSIANPIDVTATAVTSPAIIGGVLDAVAENGQFDAIAVQFTTNADPSARRMADEVVARARTSAVPVYVSRYGPDSLAPDALEAYRAAGIPVLGGPERLVAALSLLIRATTVVSRGGEHGFRSDG